MAITRFAKPAELAPIDFDFLMKNKMYQDQKQDAASKTVDELTGVLASLNPAPGNIEWGTDISKKYNEAMGSIASDVGKVPIEQTMSDARKLRSNFINNPEVKTILNNKDYYDKVLAPYLANKENKFNVNMMPYLDQNTGEFKPNKLSYAGSLSYVPYQNVTDWADKQFKEAELRLSEDLRSKGMEIFTEPTTGLKYYTAGGERKYVRNEESFKPIIESTVDILMSGQNPESRFLKSDAEWKQPGSFNRDYVRNIISPLTTKYYTEKIEGQPTTGWVPGQGNGSNGGSSTTSVNAGVPYIEKGNISMAITPEEELAQAGNPEYAKTYKSNDPSFVNNTFANLQKSYITLQALSPENLKIDRTIDASTSKVNYNIGMSEDEFANMYPEQNRQQARNEYRAMAIEFNSKALQEQHLIKLYDKALETAKNKVLGSKEAGMPGYNPDRKTVEDLIDVVENYAAAPESARKELDKILYPVIDALVEGQAWMEKDEDGVWRYGPTTVYKGNPEEAPSVQLNEKIQTLLKQGIIHPSVKKAIYREKAKQYPILSKFSTNSFSPDDDLVNKEYKALYDVDQMKSYNVISYDLPSTSEKDTPYLAKIQQDITKSLVPNLTVTDKGKKVWEKGKAVDNYVYYYVDPGSSDGRMYNGKTLFGEDQDKNQGVDIQGLIYDRESGFWWSGNLRSEDAAKNGTKVLVRPENQEAFNKTILDNISLTPGTAETLSAVRTVIESMSTGSNDPQAVKMIDPADSKVQKIFEGFGMENVYISGNDASGYDLTYNTRIKGVPVDSETGMLPTKHYSDITS